MKSYLWLLLSLLCPIVLCGQEKTPPAVEISPTAVVRACLERANKFDYQSSARFFDSGSLRLLESTDAFKPLMDTWTRKGTVAEFLVLREVIKGDRAVVTASIKFGDGGVVFNDLTMLILRKGAWKIVGAEAFTPPRSGPTGTIE